MTVLRFSIPGQVRGWARAGVSGRHGKPQHFTTQQTRSTEQAWAFYGQQALAGADLINSAVAVEITARFVPPRSHSKKRQAAMLAGEIIPTCKPDLDNIIKNIDGLNGVVWRDDVLVARLAAAKVYAPTAGVDIVIRPIGAAK